MDNEAGIAELHAELVFSPAYVFQTTALWKQVTGTYTPSREAIGKVIDYLGGRFKAGAIPREVWKPLLYEADNEDESKLAEWELSRWDILFITLMYYEGLIGFSKEFVEEQCNGDQQEAAGRWKDVTRRLRKTQNGRVST